jgi:aminopeptidase N
MVLHTLRRVLGDQNFWAGIRLYSSRFRNSSATTDDFRKAMEDACHASEHCPEGEDDLSWFFREWLNRGGIMQLKGSWRYDAAAKQLRITIDQQQSQGVYRMPIEIGITSQSSKSGSAAPSKPESARSIRRILLDKQHNELTFPLDSPPLDVQLDPNGWVPLMQATLQKQ